MKTTILLLMSFLICSCYYDKQDGVKTSKPDYNDYVPNFKTIIIDKCEYIFAAPYMSYRGYLAHKGNCKFCAERRKKELESITKR